MFGDVVARSDRLVGAEQLQLLDASWRTDMLPLRCLPIAVYTL